MNVNQLSKLSSVLILTIPFFQVYLFSRNVYFIFHQDWPPLMRSYADALTKRGGRFLWSTEYFNQSFGISHSFSQCNCKLDLRFPYAHSFCVLKSDQAWASSKPDRERSETSILSAQVALSTIFHTAAKKLYSQSSTAGLERQLQIALTLERDLETLISNLPEWLNPDIVSFKETKWMSKQRLALEIRTKLPPSRYSN